MYDKILSVKSRVVTHPGTSATVSAGIQNTLIVAEASTKPHQRFSALSDC